MTRTIAPFLGHFLEIADGESAILEQVGYSVTAKRRRNEDSHRLGPGPVTALRIGNLTRACVEVPGTNHQHDMPAVAVNFLPGDGIQAVARRASRSAW